MMRLHNDSDNVDSEDMSLNPLFSGGLALLQVKVSPCKHVNIIFCASLIFNHHLTGNLYQYEDLTQVSDYGLK